MSSKIEPVDYHGLKALQLTTATGASAVVSLLGAQVLSWKSDGKNERLYLSEQARFDGRPPIRGGIPVCFPQFAAQGKLPRHGFLRTKEWRIEQQRIERDFSMAVLSIASDEQTLSLWPYMFSAEITVLIEGTRLDIELEIQNTGHAPFAFTTALHTYLRTNEVENTRLTGLHGHEYLDAVDNKTRIDNQPVLIVDGETDRIYHDIDHPLIFSENKREVRIRHSGFPDTVVWNPWEHRAKNLDDMPDRDFRHMLCVEAAAVRSKIALDAGDTWTGRQTLLAAS